MISTIKEISRMGRKSATPLDDIVKETFLRRRYLSRKRQRTRHQPHTKSQEENVPEATTCCPTGCALHMNSIYKVYNCAPWSGVVLYSRTFQPCVSQFTCIIYFTQVDLHIYQHELSSSEYSGNPINHVVIQTRKWPSANCRLELIIQFMTVCSPLLETWEMSLGIDIL